MKQRILTAVIALIILVPLIVYGGLPFTLAVYAFAIIGLYELMRMYTKQKSIRYVMISIIFVCLLMYPMQLPFHIGMEEILLVFLLVLLTLTVVTKNTFTFNDSGFTLLATLYVATTFQALIDARMAGLHYLLFILFIIWATDSGAYFVGKSFGKRKLWPEISPNKTIGGAIGGVIFALIIGILFPLVYPFEHSLMVMVFVAVLISIVGQLGDLVASAMKRHYGIKDFGKVFPGHGGVLDRLDSLLFVLLLLKLIHFI